MGAEKPFKKPLQMHESDIPNLEHSLGYYAHSLRALLNKLISLYIFSISCTEARLPCSSRDKIFTPPLNSRA